MMKRLSILAILLISLTASCTSTTPTLSIFSEVIPVPDRIVLEQADDLQGIILEYTRLIYAYDELYEWVRLGEEWYLAKHRKAK